MTKSMNSIVTATVLAVALAIMVLPGSSARANTVTCPAGFVCSPIINTSTVKCPTGDVCTPTATPQVASQTTSVTPQAVSAASPVACPKNDVCTPNTSPTSPVTTTTTTTTTTAPTTTTTSTTYPTFFRAVAINNNVCPASSIVTIASAIAMCNFLQSSSTKAEILNPANLYLNAYVYYNGNISATSDYQMYLCLQPGYVSNVPTGIVTTGLLSGTSTDVLYFAGNRILGYEATTSPYTQYSQFDTSAYQNANWNVLNPFPASYVANLLNPPKCVLIQGGSCPTP